MPFRIKVFLSVLLAFAGVILVAPLVIPIKKLKETVSEASLASGDSLFADLPGLRVHYNEAAAEQAGPALVLLHGYAFNTRSWRDVLPALALNNHVIAFDRPAFGLTSRPKAGDWAAGENPYSPEGQVKVTIALLDELGIDQAVLVGHSAGGAVALEAALEHPDRIKGLVLAAPAVYNTGGPPPALKPVLNSPHMKRMGPLLMRQLSGDAGLNFVRGNWAEPDSMPDEAFSAYVLNFSAHDWDKALWEVSRASHENHFLAELHQVTLPVLVIAGSADEVVPAAEAEKLAAALPDGDFQLLEGCGHAVHEECAPEFNRVVSSWLQDHTLLAQQAGQPASAGE